MQLEKGIEMFENNEKDRFDSKDDFEIQNIWII